jgi:hypothetical protein
MQVSPSRLLFLNETLEGLKATGVSLFRLHAGKLVPAAETDDIGASWLIPQIAYRLNLSIPQAIDCFYYSLIAVCFVLGVAGSCRLYRRLPERLMAFCGLSVITLVCIRVGDVYVFAPCLTMGLVPWLMHFLQCQDRPKVSGAVFCFAALIVAFFHYLRAHSGTGVLILAGLGLLLVSRFPLKTKIVTLVISGILMILPVIMFKTLVYQRDNYIRKHNPEYRLSINRHPFWHSVYIGLGFVYNSHVPGYDDEVGVAKAKSLDPSSKYITAEYENLLKHEVFKIHSPTFWINNFGAKAGVIAAYLLIFGNIGVVLRLWMRKPFAFDLPFLGAMAFSALPGLLVVPYREYLLGFIALAVLYNVAYINYLFFSKSPLDTSDRRDEVGINSPAPISR